MIATRIQTKFFYDLLKGQFKSRCPITTINDDTIGYPYAYINLENYSDESDKGLDGFRFLVRVEIYDRGKSRGVLDGLTDETVNLFNGLDNSIGGKKIVSCRIGSLNKGHQLDDVLFSSIVFNVFLI